jgi:O-antigen/teichoic acid export membrane protein
MKFIKNFINISKGNFIAQLFSILSAPIIARLYLPHDLGFFQFFINMTIVLSIIFSLGLPQLIVKQENNKLSDIFHGRLLNLSLSLLSIIFIIIFFISFVSFENNTIFVIFLLFLSCLFFIFSDANEYFFLRSDLFSFCSAFAIANSLLSNLLKIIFGINFDLEYLLIYSYILALAIASITTYHYVPQKIKLISTKKKFLINPYVSFLYLRRHLSEGFNLGFFKLINFANILIPIYLLSFFYGFESAGYYSLCYSILILPINIISNSLGSALYPNISVMIANCDWKKYKVFVKNIKKFIIFSIVIGISLAIIFSSISEYLFYFIFGSDWIKSSVFANYLIYYILFIFIMNPLTRLMPLFEFSKTIIVVQFFGILLQTLLFIYSYFYFQDDTISILFFSIGGIFYSAISLIIIFKSINKKVL